ncbi:MAG TPA: hypothetical protein DEF07_03085, partial [Nitrosomonas sp.]|nr:hypothetical protein [Nitrosomonas sp.]
DSSGGEYDNMMIAAQTQRFAHVLGTKDVQISYIPRAGHFPATDNPDCVTVRSSVLSAVLRAIRHSLTFILAITASGKVMSVR